MAHGDASKYIDNPPNTLLLVEKWLHKGLPLILILLFGYLGVYFFTDVSHIVLILLENIILLYFIAEIGIAFLLYDSKRAFLKDKWLNILLVLPFLFIFRAAGRLGQAINGLRTLEAVQFIHLAETPLIGRAVQNLPKLQKAGHGVADLPKVLKKIRLKRSWGTSQQLSKAIGPLVIAILFGRRRSNTEKDTNDGEDIEEE